MMDDDDVLLENDPLAIYLLKENIRDFETIRSTYTVDNPTEICKEPAISHLHQDLKSYFEKILQSELLLQEDYSTLETYNYNCRPYSSSILKTTILSSFTLTTALICKYLNVKIILPICFAPLAYNIYKIMKRKLKLRLVSQLLNELNHLTSSIKKSLRIINEFSTTIGYYSAATIHVSSINNMHIRFTKEFYSILLSVIKILALATSNIMTEIPLNIDNYIKHDLNPDLLIKSDINLSDLKLIFELYLLIQSDFIKTLGLSFCNYLWSNPHCNINNLVTKVIPNITNLIRAQRKRLDHEYLFLKNYGFNPSRNENYKSLRKIKNSPLNYMNSCLHSTELYFQQLLCKTRDLQCIIDEVDSTNENKTKFILIMLNEMDKQITSSKTMLDAVIKYFNQIQNKTIDTDAKIGVQQPINIEPNQPLVTPNVEMRNDKLVYELYIPKEGLDLTELELDSERPVFSVKNLNYSGLLLEELRTILRARNPEMFQEEHTQQKESESDDEDDFKSNRTDIYRPSQPVGLAENLISIKNVLAARKNMMQNEECFDDSDGSADEIR